jgi:anti-sigma factor ChrR (cupin superfamily)
MNIDRNTVLGSHDRGTRIPAHLHPGAVEHMLVLEGVVETIGGRRCERGDF